MNELIFAFAMISMPPEAEYEPTVADVFLISMYGKLIRECAVTSELLDERERAYSFNLTPMCPPLHFDAVQGEWVTDLKAPMTVDWSLYFNLRSIRKHCEELGDAPCVADAQRFPAKATLDQWMLLNRQFDKQLEWNNTLTCGRNFGEINVMRAANNKRWELLDTLRDVKREYYYIWLTRMRLKHLRDDLLGPDMYYRGAVPSPVPLEYFRELQ